MRSARLFLLAAASVAVLTAAAPALAQVQPSDPWAQATSDVPADTNVRFGVLANGMQYAIMRNATPPGQASFRLRLDAGSLMENEDQLGLAHFMEHMAFNGTTNVPENELLRILERLGLAFGADTNASTGFVPLGKRDHASSARHNGGRAPSSAIACTPRSCAASESRRKNSGRISFS